MKKLSPIAALALCIIAAVCCNHNRPCLPASPDIAVLVPEDTLPAGIRIIMNMPVCEVCTLAKLHYTDPEYLVKMQGPDDGTYDNELNPPEAAFFTPETGVAEDETSRRVMLRYNCAAVFNRVVHAEELYLRKISAMENMAEVAEECDTLRTIAEDQPGYDMAGLAKYIKDPEALNEAEELLLAYSRYDGNVDTLFNAYDRFGKYFLTLPELFSDEQFNEFEEKFWGWYDKNQYVEGYDDIIKLRLNGTEVNLTDEQCDYLGEVVLGEQDIDRRTILSMELAYHNWPFATLLLGEIIESGIYTKYLIEAWLLWRAKVQHDVIGISSFCTIPDNYYDMMRAKCVNTILKHLQETGDSYDAVLIENFIEAEVMHRQDGLLGNQSYITIISMKQGTFADPRFLED